MLIENCFRYLYPDKRWIYTEEIKYSGKFKGFNGNIRKTGKHIQVSLGRDWEDTTEEIKMGIIQVLLNKLFKTNIDTVNIDLYNIFLKNAHIGVRKTKIDPELKESFQRVDDIYLNGLVELPNLIWGNDNTSKLGSYDFGTDTIMISNIFNNEETPRKFIDLVMYHEMLHKKHKFKSSGKRSAYHTKEFKADERKFKDFDAVEHELKLFLRKKKRRGWWFS